MTTPPEPEQRYVITESNIQKLLWWIENLGLKPAEDCLNEIRQHPYPEQCPHWECIGHDGVEWCCNRTQITPPKMAISKENRCTLNCPAIRDDGGPYYCRIKQKYVAPFEKRCNYGFDIVKGGQITHNGYHDECEAFSLFCDTPAQQRIADVIEKLEIEASKQDGKDILVANAFRSAIARLREEQP